LSLAISPVESKLENISPLLELIGDYVVGSVRKNIDDKGRPNPWRSNIFGTHPLKRTGDSYNRIRKQIVSDQRVEVTSGGGSAVYHHAEHAVNITGRMRKFFWAKFYETQVDIWKYLALTKKSQLFFPERRYMMFQVPADAEAIVKMVERYFVGK